MLEWFQAHMLKEERGPVSRADRGENNAQKMLVDLSTPPRGQAKGVGGPCMTARVAAALSFAPTRRLV
jgi:hypothetical protein